MHSFQECFFVEIRIILYFIQKNTVIGKNYLTK